MSEQQFERLLSILQGIGTEAFNIAERQVYLEAFANIAFAVLWLLLIRQLVKWTRARWADSYARATVDVSERYDKRAPNLEIIVMDNDGWVAICTGTATVLFSFLFIQCVVSVYGQLLNPHWYTLQFLARLALQK